MPLITRVFIKSGLIFFFIALLIGIAARTDMFYFAAITPLFWHTLMVGWITQIIMGVSMWMFPGRKKVESFQNQKWAWITFVLLNIGLGLRVIAEPFVNYGGPEFWKYLLLISAILQFIAICSYVIEIWPRVMSNKQRIKRRKAAKQKG